MKKYLIYNGYLNKYKFGIVLFLSIFFLGIFLGFISECRITKLNLGQSEKFYSIFKNNFFVGLSLISLGALTGGVYSVLVIGINGYFVGQLFTYLMDRNIFKLIIKGFLPHAAFEVFGLICFALISCLPIICIFKWLTTDKFKLDLYNLKVFIKNFTILLLLGTVLLIIASFVESNISVIG